VEEEKDKVLAYNPYADTAPMGEEGGKDSY
jgi:hypothetical protein